MVIKGHKRAISVIRYNVPFLRSIMILQVCTGGPAAGLTKGDSVSLVDVFCSAYGVIQFCINCNANMSVKNAHHMSPYLSVVSSLLILGLLISSWYF